LTDILINTKHVSAHNSINVVKLPCELFTDRRFICYKEGTTSYKHRSCISIKKRVVKRFKRLTLYKYMFFEKFFSILFYFEQIANNIWHKMNIIYIYQKWYKYAQERKENIQQCMETNQTYIFRSSL